MLGAKAFWVYRAHGLVPSAMDCPTPGLNASDVAYPNPRGPIPSKACPIQSGSSHSWPTPSDEYNMVDHLVLLKKGTAQITSLGLAEVSPMGSRNAYRLARDTINHAIVLLEPCNNAEHMEYERMYLKSPTFRGLNRLIQGTSDRKYTLEDVMVLDIRTYVTVHMREGLIVVDRERLLNLAYTIF